jgi:hypothetical protein
MLIHGWPEVTLLAVDLDEEFIDRECGAIVMVLSFQSSGIAHAELDSPQSDCLAADSNTSLDKQIFNISMAAIEAIVEPDCVRNGVWWKATEPILNFVCEA